MQIIMKIEQITETIAAVFPFFPPIIILNPAFLYSSSNTQAIAIKWGNCQKNCIANNTPPARPNPVISSELTKVKSKAATQPNKKGIAPGIAPTKIDRGEILFNGV